MKNSKIKAVVVTVSDSRVEADDVTGETLRDLLIESGAEIIENIIVEPPSDDPARQGVEIPLKATEPASK